MQLNAHDRHVAAVSVRNRGGIVFALVCAVLVIGNAVLAQQNPQLSSNQGESQMSRSILVCFTWSFSNIGDIGITAGLLNLLEQHIPGTQVTLVANSHADETSEYLATRFPSCKLIATPFRSEKPTPEFMEAFENADLILYNSGTTLSFGRWKRDWNQTMRFAMPLVMARDAIEIHNDFPGALEKVDSAMDFVHKRQTETMAIVKESLE